MSLDPDRLQQLASRLEGLFEQTAKDPEIERVHRLRTNSRRLETLLKSHSAPMVRKNRKLLALLRRARRRAGKVRDLDVQIAALEGLHASHAGVQKQQLLRRLQSQRSRQAGKLSNGLDRATVKKLQRRLQVALEQLLAVAVHGTRRSAEAATQRAIVSARRRFAGMNRPLDALSDPELHAYRIECKRLRYRLEAIGNHRESSQLASRFKRIQDAVGSWHDWLTLTQNAGKYLPQGASGALAKLLQQRTRRRHAQALRVIAAVREQFAGDVAQPPRSAKPATPVQRRRPTAAAA